MSRFLNWRSVALLVLATILSACGAGGGGGEEDGGVTAVTATPALAVISTTPANGATGVALDATISVVASRNLAAASISNATFTLVAVGGGPVTVGTAVSGATATFEPVVTLLPATQYVATVSTGVTDTAGVPLPAVFMFSFTTVGPPGAPTIGTASAGDTQATVTFTPPASNGGAAITSYTATSFPDGITATGAASPIVFPLGSLTNGTPYTFTVTATNLVGAGPPSAPSNSVTPQTGAAVPGAPTGAAVLGPPTGDSQATVSFTPGAAGSSATTNFAVNAQIGGVPTGISASGGASPIVVPGLTNGTAYTFTVTAFNSAGPSLASAPSAAATPAGSPGAPTGVGAVSSAPAGSAVGTPAGLATVTFSAPASNGGSAIAGYTVTSNPGGGVDSNAGSPGLSHSITGLIVGTPYTFTVTATNGVPLTGPPSAASNSVTPVAAATVPGAPTGAIAAGGNAQATVAFTPPASNGGAAIISYTVTSSPSGITASGGASPIVIPGLSNGTAYTFTVRATNSVGTGAASAPTNSVTPATVPGVPTGPVASAGNLQATVSFTPPASNGGSAITSYTVTSTPGGIAASGGASPILVSGLTNGIAYTFTVTATNGIGTGGPSVATGSVTPTAGSVPGNPTAAIAAPGNTQATVSFTPPASNGGSAITGYTVTSNPDGITATGGASPIVFPLGSLTNGTVYVFTVTATNSVGTGPASGASNPVVPAALPGAPVAPAATAGSFQATVAFTPPSSNGCAITSYAVTSTPGGITAFGAASPIVVPGLTNGTSYTFAVSATNCVGTGPSASTASVTPNPGLTVPSAPTGASAVAGNGQATVSFTSPPAFTAPGCALPVCSPITSFTVTSNPDGITATGGASPIVVPGLTNGTAYTFSVVATNGVGNGPASGASNTVTPATVPGVPTAATATAGSTQATVSFTPPASNGGSPIIDYTVAVCSPVCVAGPTGTASPIVVTGLTNGFPGGYTFTVTARNAIGSGTASAPSNNVTPSATASVPGAPTGASATAGNAQATVTFSAPASDGGSAITGYTVTSSPTNITASSAGAAPPPGGIVVPGLTNGTAYTFTVTATNSVGTGPSSGASNTVTPVTAPGVPTAVSAIAGNAQATVSFTPPASNGGAAITSYTVTSTPDGITASGSASPIVVGVTNFTAYTFTVKATNLALLTSLDSAPSNSVTPTSATVPSAPTGASAVAGNGQATVSFTSPPAFTAPGCALPACAPITSFTVTSIPDGITATGGASPLVVPGLTNATAYTFTVTATNAIGISPASAPSNSVTPAGAPGAPTGVSAVAGNTQATVSFTPPASNGGAPITGYSLTCTPACPLPVPTGAASPIVATGLTNGIVYTFTVAATNGLTGPSSLPSNSVIPTALATACSPTVPVVSGAISLRAQANRVSGVAPLSVLFDATATTSSATTKPFHEIEYRWAFGDTTGTGTGAWAFGARAGVSSKNQATGPVASHIYDPAPGSGTVNQTVTLTATDGTSTATCSIAIVVTDPDVDFAASTLCASDNGSFAGCPAGATQVTNADFDNVINAVALNGTNFKRILFRAGGNYAWSAIGFVRASGPGYVGVYPAGGPRAIISGIAGGPSPKIALGSNTNNAFGDWRFVDLDFDGVNNTGNAFSVPAAASRITFLRNRFRNLDVVSTSGSAFGNLDAINVASTLAPIPNQWAFVDNVFSSIAAGGFIIALTSSAFQGNQFVNIATGHMIRMSHAQKLVISNNEITAGSTPASITTAITVRGVRFDPAARFVAPGATGGNVFTFPNPFTEEVVISDNRLVGGASTALFNVHAVTFSDDTRFRNIIVERNYLVSGPNVANIFNTESSLITVRNNIFDYNGLTTGNIAAIALQQNGGPPMNGIAAYNNSVFTPLPSASFVVVILGVPNLATPPTDVIARNNLGYAPNNTNVPGTIPVNNLGAGTVTVSNNSSGLQIRTVNPLFATFPPTAPAHWQPTGASYAINAPPPAGGPVFRDFFDAPRTGNHIGAVNP